MRLLAAHIGNKFIEGRGIKTMDLKKISIIAGIIVALFSIGGSLYALDGRWAKDTELQQIGYRLDQKILQDDINYTQRRIWQLEDRHGSYNQMPQTVKEEYRQLKAKLEQLLKAKRGP
jgi:type II secretory pathway component PulJ